MDSMWICTATAPLPISANKNGNNLLPNWPGNIVCSLQMQTNAATQGIGTNWKAQPTATNQFQIQPNGGSGYFRISSPWFSQASGQ